ncbi:MAG: glycosyltransferase [Bdellovibrionota bacterium]|nr:glycosyltransferase [Bdellovibrionota bacterium]
MRTNSPLVSIILPVYKEPPEFFENSYNSLNSQSYKNLEIIVILDNPEHHKAIEYFSTAAKNNLNTHFYINEENLGLIKTLNIGINIAKGEFIARMDSDDISMPSRIKNQLSYLQENSLDFVGGFANTIDSQSSFIGNWKMPVTPNGIREFTKYHTPVLHPTWLCKTKVLKILQGYREIKHVEDHDLVARAILEGFNIGNLPEQVIQYRINPESISNTNSQWAYWGRVFIGLCFSDRTLNQITKSDFEDFIEHKISLEYDDPRKNYHLLVQSFKRVQFISFLESFFKLIKSLPQVIIRIRNKFMIKYILLKDGINSSWLFRKT